MKIKIEYLGENETFPYFWLISRNGCNEGYGWATTEKQAFEDAYSFYVENHKWEWEVEYDARKCE